MISIAVASVLLITAFVSLPMQAQTGNMTADTLKPVPADVAAIFKKSCIGCHSEPGNKMAMLKLNFSKWDGYSPEKQAAKANTMCEEVTKGKMPPPKFVLKNPETALSPEEVKRICEWAASFHPEQ